MKICDQTRNYCQVATFSYLMLLIYYIFTNGPGGGVTGGCGTIGSGTIGSGTIGSGTIGSGPGQGQGLHGHIGGQIQQSP